MLPDNIASPRTLAFPTDGPIGWIDMQPWPSQDTEPWIVDHEYVHDTTWHRVGAAQGKVNIPTGMVVRLRLNRWVDFSFLTHLEPYSIQHLVMAHVPVEDSNLQYLSHMKGLRTLNLWGTHVSSQGLRYLENLQALEHLSWCRVGPYPQGTSGSSRVELASLSQLVGLKSIWLAPDDLEGEQLRFLTNLPHLRSLHLFNVYDLDDMGWLHLGSLGSLRSLGFHGGAVSERALMHISKLASLENLDFGDTESVDGNGFTYLEALENLRDLSLNQVFRGFENRHLSSLQRIPALESVGLNRCQVNEVGLYHLATIPKLRGLDISGDWQTDTRYSRHAMQQLETASGLEQLDLSYIEIQPGGLQSLKQLPRLRELQLTYTNVTDDDLEVLKPLTQLEGLNLTGTDITDDGLGHLVSLTRLKELHLEGTQVSGTGLQLLSGLTDLHTLELGSGDRATLFETGSLAHLAGNPIQVLTINKGHTPIHSVLGLFPELCHLGLFGMPLSGEDARQVGSLAQLRSLYLGHGSTDFEAIGFLAGLRNLQILHLVGTVLPETAASALGKLYQLEEVSLQYTSITGDALAELQEKLPNCQVFGD